MSKFKTNRSAAKRFRSNASGLYKHRSSFRNHILTKKSSKRKSRLAFGGIVDKSDSLSVKKMLMG